MTLPGEASQGLQNNQLTEEVYGDILDSVGRAGWAFAGGGDGNELPYQIGIVRLDGRGDMSPEEAIARLDLADEEGQLLPGYEVKTDEESGQLALSYEGPGDPRYIQFLGGVVALGNIMDTDVIQNSPYPQALEQWRQRHLSWAEPRVYEAFEPHVSPSLKALRDHVVIEENGVTALMGLLAENASSNTVAANRDQLSGVAGDIEVAMAAETPYKRDDQLDIALQKADSAISSAVERYQTRALGVPGVTEAFAREVLVDDPLYDSEPLAEEELAELLDFEDGADEDGPAKTKELKLIQFGNLLYQLHLVVKPEGIRMMFDTGLDYMDGKTAREVIDSGSAEEYGQLLDHAAGLRSMPVS